MKPQSHLKAELSAIAGIHISLDPWEILNVNLMAHGNRGAIFQVPAVDFAEE
jgi:hypothetical protein